MVTSVRILVVYESEKKMYTVAYGDGAVEVLQEAIGGYDGTKYFIHEKPQSRKLWFLQSIKFWKGK
ncbi:hypothetical protein [Butyrivibrio sp. YAB3001]|uniref:hypothetical protein n=1 Tax=Butyrivibrio sp. YAB3001 TaxID=1520812 RepID=UPI0008F650DF|nr:hypothetical protein [Butyrivibrio sp. YAB3001]SFB99673.1 hypothetical protein SAMN02910398_01263 [Butyrivibrio sp. YAB3001]